MDKDFLHNQNSKQYLLSGLVVVWSVGLLLVGLVPSILGAYASYTIASQTNDDLVVLEARLAEADKLRGIIRQNEDVLGLVDESIPQNPKVITFMNAINLLVSINGLSVEGINHSGKIDVSKITDEQGNGISVGKLDFSVEARGDYDEVKNLIQSFDNYSRLIRVRSYSVSGRGELGQDTVEPEGRSEQLGNTHIRILGSFYYFNE